MSDTGFNLPPDAVSTAANTTFPVVQVNPFGDAALGPISSAGIVLRVLGPLLVMPALVYVCAGYNQYERRAGKDATALGYLQFLGTGYHKWARHPLPDVAPPAGSRFRVERKSHLPIMVDNVPVYDPLIGQREKVEEGIQTEDFDIEAQQKRGKRKQSRSIRAIQRIDPDEIPPVPALPVDGPPAYRTPSPIPPAEERPSSMASRKRLNSCISQDGRTVTFAERHVKLKRVPIAQALPLRRPRPPMEDAKVGDDEDVIER